MPPGSFPIGTGVPLDFGPGHNPSFTGDLGPRLYNMSLTSGLSFVGGADLYPDPALYPSPDQYPYGGALLAQINRVLPALVQPLAAFSTHTATARTFTAGLQPRVVFLKTSARVFLSAALLTSAFTAQRISNTTAKALFASLRAAGSFSSILNPGSHDMGGGGFGVPMPDAFFVRYKPTLRRQKVKL